MSLGLSLQGPRLVDWYFKADQPTIVSPQMIGRHGRVRTGGFVWSQVIVTVMQAQLLSARTSRKLTLPVIGMINNCLKYPSQTGKQYACTDQNNQTVANDKVKSGDVCEIICPVSFLQLNHNKQEKENHI